MEIDLVLERLKSIRKTEGLVSSIAIKEEISLPYNEQQEILNLLDINLP